MAPARSNAYCGALGRRAVATLVAATASLAPPYPTVAAAPPEASSCACAIAAIAPGFLVAPEQYALYRDLLEELSIPTVVVDDHSTLTHPTPIAESSAALLAAVDAVADSRALPSTTPLVLLAHSRGAKAAVRAAEAASRPVAAMILLDPVDATVFEGESIMESLANINVPTAICGSGVAGDCAPSGSNYAEFYNAIGSSTSTPPPPRLLALLRGAGHMQYLSQHGGMLDVCASGTDNDDAVHDVALAVLATWLAAFVPWPGSTDRSPLRSKAVTLGTGRASASYLMLAQKTSEACAARDMSATEETLATKVGVGSLQRRMLPSRMGLPRVLSAAAAPPPTLCAQDRSVECLAVLRQVRFGADVQFSIDGRVTAVTSGAADRS